MDQLFPLLGHWAWWVAAGVLLIIELLAPGVFFIWLGIAAGLTGLVDMFFDLPWQGELMLFAVLAIASVGVGRRFYRGPGAASEDSPFLNRRQLGYVGQSFVLREPIVGGHGRLSIEDTLWDVEGPDLPAGTRVKVTSAEGPRLRVQAV